MAEENKTEVTDVNKTDLEQNKNDGFVKTTKTEQNKTEAETTEQNKAVDVEKVKSDALADFLNSLGVEDTEKLKGIVNKAKEEEEANKTELEKKDDALTEVLKQLASERDARIISDARYEALKFGARPEMVDDLVVVAKSKVTKDKNISTVIAEIKDSESGKFYFVSDDESEEQKTNVKNVTRKRVQSKQTNSTQRNGNESEGDTFASRYFANKRKRESHFFK